MKVRKTTRYLIMSVLIVSLALTVMGCGGNPDPVIDDLTNYYNDGIGSMVEDEMGIILAYEDVAGENYVDDATFIAAIENQVVPKTAEYLDKLKEIKPATKVVQDLHAIYIQAWTEQYEAFTLMVESFNDEDDEAIIIVNEKLANASDLMVEYRFGLMDLMEEYDVDLD